MQLARRPSLIGVVLVLTACAGAAPATPTPVVPTPTPLVQVIQVRLLDAMRIEPSSMTVRAGQPVTFVVTNDGVLDHEFYLGDEEMQADHAAEMAGMGGMMPHDEENGIAVEPGETKELVYTFAEAGEWLAGCHVLGHYAAGMKATITITD